MIKQLVFVTLILILSTFTTTCKKNIFDKRTKFLGNYNFKIEITCTPNLGDCDTLYYFDGSIEYSENKSKLKINFDENRFLEPEIDENNKIIQCIDHYQSNTLGEFINKNELKFSIRSGGLGGAYYTNVYGKKVRE